MEATASEAAENERIAIMKNQKPITIVYQDENIPVTRLVDIVHGANEADGAALNLMADIAGTDNEFRVLYSETGDGNGWKYQFRVEADNDWCRTIYCLFEEG